VRVEPPIVNIEVGFKLFIPKLLLLAVNRVLPKLLNVRVGPPIVNIEVGFELFIPMKLLLVASITLP